MCNGENLFSDVRDVVAMTLGLMERAKELTPTTKLLDSMPEFDSMSVLSVMLALEKRFDIVIQDDEVTAEIFETVGTLARFVEAKRAE